MTYSFKPALAENYRFRVISDDKVGNQEQDFSDVVELSTVSAPIFTTINGFSLNKLFPNPSNETINLELSLQKRGMLTVSIIDLAGRIVQTPVKNQYTQQGLNSYSFDVGHLTPDFYNCKCTFENRTVVQKIIVN